MCDVFLMYLFVIIFWWWRAHRGDRIADGLWQFYGFSNPTPTLLSNVKRSFGMSRLLQQLPVNSLYSGFYSFPSEMFRFRSRQSVYVDRKALEIYYSQQTLTLPSPYNSLIFQGNFLRKRKEKKLSTGLESVSQWEFNQADKVQLDWLKYLVTNRSKPSAEGKKKKKCVGFDSLFLSWYKILLHSLKDVGRSRWKLEVIFVTHWDVLEDPFTPVCWSKGENDRYVVAETVICLH